MSLNGVVVRSYSWHGGRAIEYFVKIKDLIEGILKETGYW